MAPAGIANLEQGRTRPSWETVIRLCRALDVSSDEFLKAPRKEESPSRVGPRGKAHEEGNEIRRVQQFMRPIQGPNLIVYNHEPQREPV